MSMKIAAVIFLIASLPIVGGEPAQGLISKVDRDALVKRVFADAVRSNDRPVFLGNIVVQNYQRSVAKAPVEVGLGVYENAEAASRAMVRMEPSSGEGLKTAIGEQHFVSSRFLVARFLNVVAWIEIDDLANGETLEGVGQALAMAVTDRAIVVRGGVVATPSISISSWEELLGGEYRVAFTSDSDLTVGMATQGREPGTRVVSGTKGWKEAEFVLRVARSTGEIAELPAAKFPEAARKAHVAGAKTPLSLEQRGALLRSLADKSLGPKERGQAMLKLASGATEEELPMIKQYLESDENSVVRTFALEAIANVQGSVALQTYRDVAQSAGQPELTRRDAVRLVRAYGGAEDVGFLRELQKASPDLEDLQVALREALRGLEGVPLKD